MTTISIIVAIADNYAIGKNNQLLWHIPHDLKRFKALTTGKTVVMGKNTYLSLPFKPLPKRQNIVITDNINDHFEGCDMTFSIDDAIEKCQGKEGVFIMGGGMVYRQFMPLAHRLYITKVHAPFDADVFFPEIDEKVWEIVSNEDHEQEEPQPLSFSYLVYERKK